MLLTCLNAGDEFLDSAALIATRLVIANELEVHRSIVGDGKAKTCALRGKTMRSLSFPAASTDPDANGPERKPKKGIPVRPLIPVEDG